MHPVLNQISDEIEEAVAGREDHQLLAAPEGKWCAAQILEHLSKTFEASGRSLRAALAGRRAGFASVPLGKHLARFMVLTLGRIPAGRQAPDFVVPGPSPEPARILELLRTNLRGLDEVLCDCEKAFGPDAPMSEHPTLGPLSVSQWRRFHLVHVRHHLSQIRERCASAAPTKAPPGATAADTG